MHKFNVVIENNEPPVEALVAELVPGQSLEDLFEAIYKLTDADARRRAAIVIVRPPVKWAIDPAAIERVQAGMGGAPAECRFLADALADATNAFVRVAGKPVYILASHAYQPFLSRNVNPTVAYSPIDDGELPSDVAINALRDAEVDLIVSTGRARLPRTSGVYYRAPSKRLMRSFLRVGNIQRSRAVLDAIFFWLLPHLRGCTAIITDTWSISSISMNVSRRLCVYSGGAAPPCPVEMLSRYHDGSPARTTEAAEIVEQLVARAGAGGRVIFLISATHTGSLASSLEGLLRERGIPPHAVHFVALFKLGPGVAPVDALRDLSIGPGADDFLPVELGDAAEAADPIEIDEQVYFPLQYRDVRYVVRQAQTMAIFEFLRRYRDVDLVRVHRTVRDDTPPRHHAVWIDTVALVRHATFQERFASHLRTLEPAPDLIITPMHEAAELLGQVALPIVRERKPHARVIGHSNLFLATPPRVGDQEAAQAVDEIPADGAILILDDAFITGTRLTGYRTHLRSRAFGGRLHHLVALARPSDLADWELRRRILRFRRSPDPERPLPRHTVDAIETIVLPDWHTADCPWCAEMNLYRRREGLTGVALSSAMLRVRLEMLTEIVATGMKTDLFLPVEGYPALEITPDSIFVECPSTQAAVFAAVASALQHLRTPQPTQNRLALGPRRFPISTVLEDAEYLEHTFTDSVLRASFFRSARRDELIFALREAEVARATRARGLVLSEVPTQSNLAGEIILAVAEGKFPELSLTDAELHARVLALGVAHLVEALV